jgi:DNA (cytosine-5)-methyltransferase 1
MSLFASGGIGETYLEEIGIHTTVANELLKDRAEIYHYRYHNTNIISGDIKENKEKLIEEGKRTNVELLIATPPCQGMSGLGKKDYKGDERNYLIFDVFDIIDALDFKYVFIENVPKFLKMYYLNNKNEEVTIEELLNEKYGDKYNIVCGVYNAEDYDVPQHRPRAIIRMYKKDLEWNDPPKSKHKITLREAIGHLPSIEAGEKSGIKWHDGYPANAYNIEMMKHTPSGCSARDNDVWFPKKKDGTPMKGFHSTYKRLSWDKPCPTRTMRSCDMGGTNNVHPGRPYVDEKTGETLYSDARTLSLLELLIVSSLPENIDLPENLSERKIRELIGEGVPPKMSKAFLKMIANN